MARIRLNQEYRNKIANRIRVHLQQEDTEEKRKYDSLKADQIDINDSAWKMAEQIVRRHYTDEDVEKAYYLQNKFENVSTIAKDSCFHFHYLGTKEKRDYNDNLVIEENVPIEKHFDFRLNGSFDTDSNYSNERDLSYGFALFRDEINSQDDCNADILIEQADKDDNPHKRKFVENNEKYLGLSGGRDNETKYGREWNEKYQLDLIGRDYDNNPIMEKKAIEKHFDFRLNGSIDSDNNDSYNRDDNGYGYALFRDELKAQEDCNPDILIEQEGKDNNPHKTKYTDNNNKYLGNDDSGYGKQWNEKYQLDLIGRDYCRDRSIACSELEFNFLIQWKQAKGQFVIAHQK